MSYIGYFNYVSAIMFAVVAWCWTRGGWHNALIITLFLLLFLGNLILGAIHVGNVGLPG